MNTNFYKDLDTNFERACKMSECEFSHKELLELLQNGNIPERQIAALRLDNICNCDELSVLLSNLTGCDGKIREAVALKIASFLNNDKKFRELFFENKSAEFAHILADATIDINANICRFVVDVMSLLKGNYDFDKVYLEYIIKFINEAYEKLDNIVFRDKKYTINKILFKLYWCLEALKIFVSYLSKDELSEILTRASDVDEYTIREKAAQIVVRLDGFENIKAKLRNDENYYVREVFKSI